MGDPAGIGPELVVRTVEQYQLHTKAEIVIYGSKDVINTAKKLFAPDAVFEICETSSLKYSDFENGKLSPECGRAAYETIRKAASDCLNGKTDAIVTAPANKAAVNLAGIPFTGHTELVAEICGCTDFAMMQSAGCLRIIFATTHIPLSKVSESLTKERITEVGRLLHNVIMEEGIKTPRIAVAATQCARRAENSSI